VKSPLRITPASAVVFQAALIRAMKTPKFGEMWDYAMRAAFQDRRVDEEESVLLSSFAEIVVNGETVFLPAETVAMVHHAAQELPEDEPFSLTDVPFEGACIFLEQPLIYETPEYETLAIEAIVFARVHESTSAQGEVVGYMSFAFAREQTDEVSTARSLVFDIGVTDKPVGDYGAKSLIGFDGDDALTFNLVPFLHSLWHLVATPMMESTHVRPIEPDVRKARKRLAARGNVRVIGLRHRPGNASVIAGPSTGRVYTQRWIVRGFWRQQRCGPRGADRKRIWIDSYIKGPSDAPLVIGDKVYKVQKG
jgi:hypothetical protein